MTAGDSSMAAKVAYIVSAGHSGSTLLDLVIGTIPGAFSTGEFAYLPWQISRRATAGPGASRQKLCGCGQGFGECPVWTDIIRELSAQAGFDIYADPFRFRVSLMQNERYFAGRFSLERVRRHLFELGVQVPALSPLTAYYRWRCRRAVANSWLAYDTIARSTGCAVIVDSSKSVLRLRLLHDQRPADLRAIILLRDIRGVAYSSVKLGGDVLAAARGWVRQYNRILACLRQMPDLSVSCVRYEDLVGDPVALRRKLARFLDLADPGMYLDIDTNGHHTVVGNGIRNRGRLEIRADMDWRQALQKSAQREIESIGAQLDPGWEALLGQAQAS